LCLHWDAQRPSSQKFNFLGYRGKAKGLTNHNKYLLVKLIPVLKGDVLEGSSKFDLDLRLKYSYNVIGVKESGKRALGDVDENGILGVGVYQKKRTFTVECDPETLKCGALTLIYNPGIKEESDHEILVGFEKTDSNKNLIDGFFFEVFMIFLLDIFVFLVHFLGGFLIFF